MNECEMLIALIKLEMVRDSSDKQEEREIKTSESRLCLIILNTLLVNVMRASY